MQKNSEKNTLKDPMLEPFLQQMTLASTLEILEQIRIEVLGKKGILTEQFSKLKSMPPSEKKAFAQTLNTLRSTFETQYEIKKQELEQKELESKLLDQKLDVSLFNLTSRASIGHPINYTKDKIIDYFVILELDVGAYKFWR